MHEPSLYWRTVPNMPVWVMVPGSMKRVLCMVPEMVHTLPSEPTDELERVSQLESLLIMLVSDPAWSDISESGRGFGWLL